MGFRGSFRYDVVVVKKYGGLVFVCRGDIRVREGSMEMVVWRKGNSNKYIY